MNNETVEVVVMDFILPIIVVTCLYSWKEGLSIGFILLAVKN